MDRESLRGGQIFFLLSLYYWGSVGLGIGGRDGPFVCLLIGVAAALLSLSLPVFCGKEPRALLGKSRHRGLSVIFSVLLASCGVLASADALRTLPRLLTAIGQETLPRPFALLIMTVLIWWMCSLGMDALGRASWLCALPVAGIVVLSLLLSIGKGSLWYVLPLLESGFPELLSESKLPAMHTLLPLPLCLLALAPHAGRSAKRPAMFAAGVFLLAALSAFRDVSVLGGALSAQLPFPSYTAGASLGRGTSRWAGMLVAAAWTAALPFRAVLPLRLSLRVLKGMWPRRILLWAPLLALLAGVCALFFP